MILSIKNISTYDEKGNLVNVPNYPIFIALSRNDYEAKCVFQYIYYRKCTLYLFHKSLQEIF